MTSTPAPARRRLSVWAWVAIGVAVVAAGLAAVLVLAGGIVGAGATTAADAGQDARDRDKALTVADPAGSKACDLLGLHLTGVGTSFDSALEAAATATTAAIRDATTPDTMRTACVDAGANMS